MKNHKNPETLLWGQLKEGDNEGSSSLGHFFSLSGYTDALVTPEIYNHYIRAEAYVKEGENTLAQNDLNVILKRANPNAPNATVTNSALLEPILEERRKELAFEGHCLFVLNRNKKDVKIIQPEKSITVSYPNDKFILPIPLKEININLNIKPKNTGY